MSIAHCLGWWENFPISLSQIKQNRLAVVAPNNFWGIAHQFSQRIDPAALVHRKPVARISMPNAIRTPTTVEAYLFSYSIESPSYQRDSLP